MMKVELTEQEWVAIINLMSFAPYRDAQPFIQKISQQLIEQKTSSTEIN